MNTIHGNIARLHDRIRQHVAGVVRASPCRYDVTVQFRMGLASNTRIEPVLVGLTAGDHGMTLFAGASPDTLTDHGCAYRELFCEGYRFNDDAWDEAFEPIAFALTDMVGWLRDLSKETP